MKTKLFVFVMLLSATCFAGEIFMPVIKYKTHAGLEAQVKKILAVVDTVVGCNHPPDMAIIDGELHKYYHWGHNTIRQFRGLTIVREPNQPNHRYLRKLLLHAGWLNWNFSDFDTMAYVSSPADTARAEKEYFNVYGKAILIYEEVEK